MDPLQDPRLALRPDQLQVQHLDQHEVQLQDQPLNQAMWLPLKILHLGPHPDPHPVQLQGQPLDQHKVLRQDLAHSQHLFLHKVRPQDRPQSLLMAIIHAVIMTRHRTACGWEKFGASLSMKMDVVKCAHLLLHQVLLCPQL